MRAGFRPRPTACTRVLSSPGRRLPGGKHDSPSDLSPSSFCSGVVPARLFPSGGIRGRATRRWWRFPRRRRRRLPRWWWRVPWRRWIPRWQWFRRRWWIPRWRWFPWRWQRLPWSFGWRLSRWIWRLPWRMGWLSWWLRSTRLRRLGSRLLGIPGVGLGFWPRIRALLGVGLWIPLFLWISALLSLRFL
jgi:hypothetical protein